MSIRIATIGIMVIGLRERGSKRFPEIYVDSDKLAIRP